jgi:hypothetical protein
MGYDRDVLRYYNLSPTQIHPNRWIILFSLEKSLRILEGGAFGQSI